MIEDVDWPTLWAKAAAPFQVSPVVHEADLLWPFIVGLPCFANPTAAADYYFSDGAHSAHQLRAIIDNHLPQAATGGRPLTLLEFASGYGMVTRHLAGAMPDAEIVSCDIHSQAVDFIRQELGGTAVLSVDEPEQLTLGREFDVVFALSFFSHLPKSSFGRWLAALYGLVAAGGVLVFTAHGRDSRAALGNPEIDADGFWFKPDSEQHDLDSARYGSTVSTPDFVIGELFRRVRAPLAQFQGAAWWGHQDLYVVARP